MFTLIENGKVYGPEPLGQTSVLLAGNTICKIGEVDASALERLFGATRHRHSVFFTGGDQVKITSQIGDTPIFNRIREIYDDGGVIAGTSAGAAVMSETMLVIGGDEQSHVKTLSIYNVRLHMLSQGDRFDLFTRAPRQMKGRAAEKLPEKEEEPSPQPT